MEDDDEYVPFWKLMGFNNMHVEEIMHMSYEQPIEIFWNFYEFMRHNMYTCFRKKDLVEIRRSLIKLSETEENAFRHVALEMRDCRAESGARGCGLCVDCVTANRSISVGVQTHLRSIITPSAAPQPIVTTEADALSSGSGAKRRRRRNKKHTS